MSRNRTNLYDADPHIAEIYDRIETDADDIGLLLDLIGDAGPLRILEPFCGTGRLLIPLAEAGHVVAGIDQSQAMLERAEAKIAALPEKIRRRIALSRADVTEAAWPTGFDLVVLGCNCFYELADADEQERCIARAAAALAPGGRVYVDNNHMEGDLDPAWRERGVARPVLSGTCGDGTTVAGEMETVWRDIPGRLVRLARRFTVTRPDGRVFSVEFEQRKHPVSRDEVAAWLARHGFAIERSCGDHAGAPYADASPRAIFWARKEEENG